ncbi:GNAT family N-acetyltransferase [Salisediminibacterium beveridgei]|uniref:N-acetyltransferase domain-containing protein n=1 Tax=Salisediminibacterium beveridgei TaxID=632773 RepID=A0A1D7QR67_9BACI|nr:GNAT family N-acetyltransferase [Salisediminibacterium beveridgei]AOM81504.1 hypothetical protein BBEV_0109 [Salisediminibacterium beveridgei]
MSDDIIVRNYTMSDFDDLLMIQKESFPPPFPEELWWNKAHIQAHTETFPDGGLIAWIGDEPAGSATSLITTLHGTDHTWEEVADNGYIRNSHDPNGDTLYGIDVCVRPKYRGFGVAKALYDERKKMVERLGLKRYVAGCRIPDFQHAPKDMAAKDYVAEVQSGLRKDRVLTFMLKQGLTVKQIIPEYLDDDESRNYGVIVEWQNRNLL